MGFYVEIETPEKKPSWMKKQPIDATKLAGTEDIIADHNKQLEKISAPSGKKFWVKELFMDRARHVRVVFDTPAEFKFGGVPYMWPDAYFYAPHIKGISQFMTQQTATAAPNSAAGQRYILLPTWYLQQNNNLNRGNEGGSSLRAGNVQCGLTSLAIALTALWPIEKIRAFLKEAEHDQIETWLQDQFIKIGAKSIEMEGHVAVLKHLGFKASCRRNATLGELKQALKLHPVVAGFEYKDSGHFNCITGYIDQPTDQIKIATPVGTWENKKVSNSNLTGTGFITQDPYGERDFSGSGNNWVRICETITDDFGMHNFIPDAVMDDFWASTDQGWAVFFDPSTPVLGGVGPKPIVLPATIPATTTPIAPERIEINQQAGNTAGLDLANSGVLKREQAMKATIPDGCSRILPTQKTLFKARPVMGSELDEFEKDSFDMDEALIGVVTPAAAGHIMVTLAGTGQIKGRNTWYVFKQHCTIETPSSSGGTSLTQPGAAITDAAIAKAGSLIGISARLMKTVMLVEAAGSGFLPSKRAKILFEAHWFADFTGGKYNSSHPNLSSRTWNSALYKGGEAEWDRLEAAMKLDRAAAIKSASWGLGQLMGAHCDECPALKQVYHSDTERWMIDNNTSEAKQLEAMAIFISDNPAMLAALKNQQWAKFAYSYNGEGYAANEYDLKLADAYASLG